MQAHFLFLPCPDVVCKSVQCVQKCFPTQGRSILPARNLQQSRAAPNAGFTSSCSSQESVLIPDNAGCRESRACINPSRQFNMPWIRGARMRFYLHNSRVLCLPPSPTGSILPGPWHGLLRPVGSHSPLTPSDCLHAPDSTYW